MDSPWDESPLHENHHRDAEWGKLSSDFTNTGYREGITAGKEGALQEGFDSGFAGTGVPLGRQLGKLRGVSSAILAFVNERSQSMDADIVSEARSIVSELVTIRFSDIAPRDLDAEQHAWEHLESQFQEDEMDVNKELSEKRKMEGIEDMLAKLTARNVNAADRERPTIDGLYSINTRLENLIHRLGILIPLRE